MVQQDNAQSSDVLQTIEGAVERLNELEIRLNRYQPTLAALGMNLNVGETIQPIRHALDKIRIETKKTRTSLEQLQSLVHTSALLTSSLELEQVLKAIIDNVVDLTGAERVYLMVRETDSGELTPRTARNWDRETIREDEIMISRKVINLAVTQKAPILTTNAQQDTRFGDSESVIRYALRSILCVPLLVRDTSVGVLYADNRIARGVFVETHIPLLAAFGTHAAVAIDNARIYAQTKSELEQARRELEELRKKSQPVAVTPVENTAPAAVPESATPVAQTESAAPAGKPEKAAPAKERKKRETQERKAAE
jgi:transcriptional regulator with GAF, ATPase, and Fis domain